MNDFVMSSVATLVIQNRQLLLSKRIDNGQFMGWQCPGGFLQKGESVEQAAQRHCLQKAGIYIEQLNAGPYSNNIFLDNAHTVTLYLVSETWQVKNQLLFENDWLWFPFLNLPEALFLPLDNLLKQYDIASLIKKSPIKAP